MLKKGEGQTGRKRGKNTLIEGTIKGPARNMTLGKFPGIHKMILAKTLSIFDLYFLKIGWLGLYICSFTTIFW